MIVVLLVLMLQQLAQVMKVFVTLWAAVRLIGDTILFSVRQQTIHVRLHGTFALSKLVDLRPSVVLATASGTVAALDVLDRVGSRTESTFTTDRACNVSRTMDLLVHLQLVRVTKDSLAGVADESHTLLATRLTGSLEPLVAAVPTRVALISTLRTHSITCDAFDAAARVLAKLVVREKVSREIVSTVGAVYHDLAVRFGRTQNDDDNSRQSELDD